MQSAVSSMCKLEDAKLSTYDAHHQTPPILQRSFKPRNPVSLGLLEDKYEDIFTGTFEEIFYDKGMPKQQEILASEKRDGPQIEDSIFSEKRPKFHHSSLNNI